MKLIATADARLCDIHERILSPSETIEITINGIDIEVGPCCYSMQLANIIRLATRKLSKTA